MNRIIPFCLSLGCRGVNNWILKLHHMSDESSCLGFVLLSNAKLSPSYRDTSEERELVRTWMSRDQERYFWKEPVSDAPLLDQLLTGYTRSGEWSHTFWQMLQV